MDYCSDLVIKFYLASIFGVGLTTVLFGELFLIHKMVQLW